MKAYKIELLYIDHENIGKESLIQEINNKEISGYCPFVMDITSKDIGEWSDNHPLNSLVSIYNEYLRLFEQNSN